MAKWIVGKGIDNYIAYLQRMELATDEIIGKAVYEMAKVVANNIKSNNNKKGNEDETGE